MSPAARLPRDRSPLPSAEAAEVLAEAQDAQAGAGRYALRADAGLRFLAMLAEAGLGDPGRCRARGISAAPPATSPWPSSWDPTERRRVTSWPRWRRTAERSPHALRADATLAAKLPGATAAQRTQLAAAATAWLALPEGGVAPTLGGNGWSESRMEYGLSLAAAAAEGEIVMRAGEYPGGRLDWDAFDISPRGPHGLAAAARKSRTVVRIPSPLRYAGMPADRWWEFEDGEVDFGSVQATPADLQRMMVAGYAVNYSGDWHVVPITLRSGQLARIRSMQVADSFGMRQPIAPMAALDSKSDASRPWRLFELSGDPGPAAGRAPGCCSRLRCPMRSTGPVDRGGGVRARRDIQSRLGGRAPRRRPARRGGGPCARLEDRRGPTRATLPPLAEGQWRYQVAPPMPAYLVPLLPERGNDAQVRLRRGRVHQGLDAQGCADQRGNRPHPESGRSAGGRCASSRTRSRRRASRYSGAGSWRATATARSGCGSVSARDPGAGQGAGCHVFDQLTRR